MTRKKHALTSSCIFCSRSETELTDALRLYFGKKSYVILSANNVVKTTDEKIGYRDIDDNKIAHVHKYFTSMVKLFKTNLK